MKKNYLGFDVLRGLGIFLLIWMHSAFYYFDGLYDLDFNNPPAVVTVIGLLLMFAGIFAVISGAVRTIQFYNKTELQKYSAGKLLKYNTVSGIYILAFAYIYFIFTGPGLVNMSNKTMNNSILVDIIRNGKFGFTNMERLLYVDSLVMLGINILLLGLIFYFFRKSKITQYSRYYFFLGIIFFTISLVRIPLYDIYINALEEKRFMAIAALNWLVNKNNPVFPYLSFGIMGSWLAALLHEKGKKIMSRVIPTALVFFAVGVALYIKLPDTMLERSIDGKWFAIMTAQMGLFLILALVFVNIFDFRTDKDITQMSPVTRFIYRFGVAGLTPFFIESIVSASVYKVMLLFFPNLSFDIKGSLAFGFILAISWGIFLMFWSKKQYKYGIEYYYYKVLKKFGTSAKKEKMEKEAA